MAKIDEHDAVAECKLLLIEKMKQLISVNNFETVQMIAHTLSVLNRDY